MRLSDEFAQPAKHKQGAGVCVELNTFRIPQPIGFHIKMRNDIVAHRRDAIEYTVGSWINVINFNSNAVGKVKMPIPGVVCDPLRISGTKNIRLEG